MVPWREPRRGLTLNVARGQPRVALNGSQGERVGAVTSVTVNALRGCVGDVAAVRQFVFAEMVKLAAPVLTHYHSDLYHDALWLNEHVNGTRAVFAWSFNGTGTTIGTDETLVFSSRSHWVRFTVTAEGGNGTVRYEIVQERVSH